MQTQQAYTVQTEVFEGPLDLLLSLIEKRKLLINEISLAKVADDFIDFVKRHPEFPLSETAHFILVASTLVLIKSKSLLPHLLLAPEEEESIEDLQERLKHYQRIKELAKHMQTMFGTTYLFAQEKLPERPTIFAPDKWVSKASLLEGIQQALKNVPKANERIPQATMRKIVSLEEMIDRLTMNINQSIRTSFHEFAGMGKSDRVHVVVSFLALLELVKQGTLSVKQELRFSDIVMERDSVDTPSYM